MTRILRQPQMSGGPSQDGLVTNSTATPHVLIIGGGASGVLLAAHLLSRKRPGLTVTLIERREVLGCGLAYSTGDPAHLLNTRVHSMSAFPDRPHHFADWLSAQSDTAGPQDFVSRTTYGRYLSGLIEPQVQELNCLQGDCLRLEETAHGIVAHLADGSKITGTHAVLATGHVLPQRAADDPVRDPWSIGAGLAPQARVVILGTGLTMIDHVLSLLAAGHKGEIVAISRRGLLPRAHRETKPLSLSRSDIPLGKPLSAYGAWLRRLSREAEAQGGSWRDVMDGVRPHIRAVWRSLTTTERGRFLRHGAAWWEVHRHRMPPSSEQRIAAAGASGQLRIIRAGFLEAHHDAGGGVTARLSPRNAAAPDHIACARIIDCRGIRRDPESHATPLVADLLARGAARVDPLRIGLEVTPSCHLIDRDGRASTRVLAIGPVSRAAFWEITAIPDIREQTAAVATELCATI